MRAELDAQRQMQRQRERDVAEAALAAGDDHDARRVFGGGVAPRLNEVAVMMGYHPSYVGAWSIRKDACEKQAL